ncbi:monofunctional biosynthetic peptidoglycan transglycosylase [Sandarakinorhabdus sp. AAP62]|uniref:monofunctional biosynthetic peptidoglycan transglycosylase n=1 Tax=Sandarakinorhabdus sp. AAP62 TaxID=1248916 RepID=UPI0003025C27|nr:monofunctional biosynthetic peptidoglycan transglycosylase [Sandarakinorhabdus sp. AAP62]
MIGRAIGVLVSWFFRLLGAVILLSIIWVVAYRFLPPPMTWLMARDAIAGQRVKHAWVPLTAMSRSLPRAVIGAEDANFCYHHGVDFEAVKAAAEANLKGRKLRGGSTISQQTAKNAFLWPERSYVRKGLEVWFTGLIELLWGKPRIMEVYLNIVEMGPGIYGMPAASIHYFGTKVDRLSPAQAAKLTAILPQPIKRSVNKPSRSVRRYARRIEKRVRVVRDEGIDACLWN